MLLRNPIPPSWNSISNCCPTPNLLDPSQPILWYPTSSAPPYAFCSPLSFHVSEWVYFNVNQKKKFTGSWKGLFKLYTGNRIKLGRKTADLLIDKSMQRRISQILYIRYLSIYFSSRIVLSFFSPLLLYVQIFFTQSRADFRVIPRSVHGSNFPGAYISKIKLPTCNFT
jgi:hypothetical protein